MTLYAAAITLILVMDPLGNIPVFLSILKRYEPKQQAAIIFRESLFAFLILVVFLFFGQHIMKGLHITTSALSIAGSIILFLIALRMIFPVEEQEMKTMEEEPYFVPLAVPLMAGPSAMATVMLMVAREPNKIGQWLLAVVIASIVCLITLLSSQFLMRFLGRRGLVAIERLMGMILTTVAVQMFLSGLSDHFLR